MAAHPPVAGSTEPAEPQRDALETSLEDATTDEPKNFRNEANADKTVEIPPDKTDAPIHGLDPEEKAGR